MTCGEKLRGHDVVDHVGRLGMRCRPAGFETAALVDRDIDEDRTPVHVPDVLRRDQFWRRSAGNQHRTDNQVRFYNQPADLMFG